MFRYIIKYIKILSVICIFITIVSIFNNSIKNEYPDVSDMDFTLNVMSNEEKTSDLKLDDTVVYRNDNINSELFPECYYALLIDDTDNNIYAAKNAHERMYPASMTKFMTAIVVCDKIEAGEISVEDVVTITNYYDLTYDDVAPCDLTPGCEITVKNLLYGLLIESNNYYGIILAEYIAGDVNTFCELMNDKSYSIGATNTHFVNPHGLDNSNHYSTPYDMYLITKEAHTHELIRTIDTYDTYSYTYINSEGYAVYADIEASNLFLTEVVSLPSNFEIDVWKTGTTDGAGYCLTMYITKDKKTYIAIASSKETRQDLYDAMVRLISMLG